MVAGIPNYTGAEHAPVHDLYVWVWLPCKAIGPSCLISFFHVRWKHCRCQYAVQVPPASCTPGASTSFSHAYTLNNHDRHFRYRERIHGSESVAQIIERFIYSQAIQ